MIIGSWYVLPDLFLVSGESVIRNFQYGRNLGGTFVGYSTVGYIPDPLGTDATNHK